MTAGTGTATPEREICGRCKLLGFVTEEDGRHQVCPKCRGAGYEGAGASEAAARLLAHAHALEGRAADLEGLEPGWVSHATLARMLRDDAAGLRQLSRELERSAVRESTGSA